jgi:3-oxoacyl-[acyl-carrier-protein] synthase-1
MATSVAITATGLVSGVGLSTAASCAAIRAAIDNFQETRFIDRAGEWILGCEVDMQAGWRGRAKLIKMAAAAIREALQACQPEETSEIPLLLCLPEQARPGRVINDDNQLFLDLQNDLQMEFHKRSRVIASGHVSVALALRHANNLINQEGVRRVLIAATDSMLVTSSLAYWEQQERLLTSQNSNGFIPGEAAAALLIESPNYAKGSFLSCQGLGFGVEAATVESGEPMKADGLATAIKESVSDAGIEMSDLDFRITDLSGEQYYFKEASLALARTLKNPKPEFDIWHPADCVGEVGAALGAIMLAVIKTACEKDYSKGNKILAHMGNDDGKRSSLICVWHGEAAQNG